MRAGRINQKFPAAYCQMNYYKPSEHFQGKSLKLSTHLHNRMSDRYSRNPYMLSKEYATSMIKYLVENGIVMIEMV